MTTCYISEERKRKKKKEKTNPNQSKIHHCGVVHSSNQFSRAIQCSKDEEEDPMILPADNKTVEAQCLCTAALRKVKFCHSLCLPVIYFSRWHALLLCFQFMYVGDSEGKDF